MPGNRTQPDTDESPDQTSSEDTQALQTWCVVHLLIEQLTVIQKRLGTPLEKDNDCTQVRALGHAIQNQLTLLQLYKDMDSLGLKRPSATGRPSPA